MKTALHGEHPNGPSRESAVTASDFQNAMARLASSVHIVTTDGSGGRGGITASSVTSVSAEPPIMLFCLNRKSSSLERFLANRCFCVNSLAPRDRPLSEVFAGRTSLHADQRFAAGAWRKAITGAPLLETALVSFDCKLLEAREISTHFILLGSVEAIEVPPDQSTLLYTRQRYAEI